MSQTASARTRRTGILALLAAIACLAGFAVVGLKTFPSGSAMLPPETVTPGAVTVTPQAGAAAPRQARLAVVSWPADGVSAADISGIGVVAGPGATRPALPIASVAKLMTAYVVLLDHPLPAGGSGPGITVQPSEAAAYPSQVRDGDSLVPVVAGETLTERQALEALLLPSADNMAWILARWDAGSQAAFVARMNDTARRLGMTGTSYTDPSGLASSTTSTAADQVRLGMAAMRVPVLAAIAAKSMAVVPGSASSATTTPCWARTGSPVSRPAARRPPADASPIAAWHRAGAHNTLIVAATFGQPGTAQTILPNDCKRPQPRARPGPRPSALACSPVRVTTSEGPPQGPAERHDGRPHPPHG